MKIVGCFTEVEVILPRKTLIEQIERLNKKFLKQILSLSKTTADPAVCVLSGIVSIEGVVHKRALTLFCGVCRLSENSVEKQLARRQLSVKGYKSHSWQICIREILLKYELPQPWDLLESPPKMFTWKR